MTMNKDILKGKWNEIAGQVRQKWGKLTEQDLEEIKGSYQELSGRLQKAYGYSEQKAQEELDEFMKKH